MQNQVEAPVRGFRNGFKKSQEEVADYIGISRRWYAKKESGEVPFNTNEIKLFAECFGLEVEKVLPIFFSPPTSHIEKLIS